MAIADHKNSPTSVVGEGMHNSSMSDHRRIEGSDSAIDYSSLPYDEEKKVDNLPSVTAPIEALGIPNWQDLEKKLVKRLDMTLMPMLWVLYLFNYLDRASISYALS